MTADEYSTSTFNCVNASIDHVPRGRAGPPGGFASARAWFAAEGWTLHRALH